MGRVIAPLVAIVLVALTASTPLAAVPGNGKIAFLRNPDVWTVTPDGTTEGRLTADAHRDLGPLVWSPDGTRLAFTSSRDHAPMATPYVVNADGTGLRELAHDPQRFYSPVCWLTPDVVLLRGSVSVSPSPVSSDLYVVHADGSGLRRLTTDGGDKRVGPESCAREGSIVYTRFAEGRPGAYWLRAEGDGAPVPLIPPNVSDGSAAISPDGSRVALVRVTAPGPTPERSLIVKDVRANGAEILVPVNATGTPAWSPDGRWLAVSVSRQVGFIRYVPVMESDVYVVAADGSSWRALTGAPGNDTVVGWSPDGTRILFVGLRERQPAALVMNADGTCETRVVANLEFSGTGFLAWQPLPDVPVSRPQRCTDLVVTARTEVEQVGLGGTVTFRFTVSNDGNDRATAVHLDATAIPPYVRRVSIQATRGSCSTATMTCAVESLAPGEEVDVAVVLRSTFRDPLPATALLEYALFAAARETENYPANNRATASVRAWPCAILGTPQQDRLEGTPGGDTICGLLQADTLLGRGGGDFLDGGPGYDRLYGGMGRDQLLGRGERDTIFAHDGERDTINCGDNEDVVIGDRLDDVFECEMIARNLPCTTIGTRAADTFTGTARREVVCGLWGKDTLRGEAGADGLDGGGGNDTLVGGTGRDILFGGLGYDVVRARDGERDTIVCGPQTDVVVADRLDRLARDCERVRRA